MIQRKILGLRKISKFLFSNYYSVLGVDKNCSVQEIKLAFKQKVKESHPDVHQKEKEKENFKLIVEAYQVLKNPAKRQIYDLDMKMKDRSNKTFSSDANEKAFY